jgi:hypothetical protein
MRLILFTFPLAIGLGYVLGGRLSNLGRVSFRWPLAGLLGVALQFAPVGDSGGYLLLVASFLLLIVAAAANWRLPGFILILAGLWLNFVVITVNEGMPVTRAAIVASGQADTLDDIVDEGGSKHHLAGPDDQLLFLADRIAIPPPVGQAVSVGDVLAYTGAMWFVVAGMLRREERPTVPTDVSTAVVSS